MLYVCYRQHQEDDKGETHIKFALNKCSSSQGIAGVGDDLPSFSVCNLLVKLSAGNVLIIHSG